MKQFSRFLFVLFLLFVVLPLVELTLLFVLSDITHWFVPLLLVVATGFLGSFLLHRQGLKSIYRIRDDMLAGKMPTDALLDGSLMLIAGALLLTPGVLTDLFALLLLIPPSRKWVKAWIVRWVKAKFAVTVAVGSKLETAAAHSTGRVVDSYVVNEQERESD